MLNDCKYHFSTSSVHTKKHIREHTTIALTHLWVWVVSVLYLYFTFACNDGSSRLDGFLVELVWKFEEETQKLISLHLAIQNIDRIERTPAFAYQWENFDGAGCSLPFSETKPPVCMVI